MSKLYTCQICKGNEVEELKTVWESLAGYIDGINLTTTQTKGYHTSIKNLAKNLKIPIKITHYDWDDNFANARQYNLDQLEDADYFLWIDTDDVFVGAHNLPGMVSQMEKMGLTALFMDYHYMTDKQTGEVVINHPRERIVKVGCYKWKGALHEVLIPDEVTPNTVYVKDAHIKHMIEDSAGKMERNLKILSQEYKKQREAGEIDPRIEYYLGRQLFDVMTQEAHDRAITLMQDYLEHSGWDEERAFAWGYLGDMFTLRGQYEDAENCYLSAMREAPNFPTWPIKLGRVYMATEQWEKAEHWVKVGLQIEDKVTAMVTTPRDDKMNAMLVLFAVYLNKRDLKKAVAMAQGLNELMPNEENKKRVDTALQFQNEMEMLKTTMKLVDALHQENQPEKMQMLLASLPDSIKDSPFIDNVRMKYMEPKVWDKKSIVYYCGPSWEPWTPKDLDKGIGGSEEAVIELSSHWASMGYQVTVYNHSGANEGVYDGVEYKNYHRFNPMDEFDVLIGWRQPFFFARKYKARVTLLDLHDVPFAKDYTPALLENIDKIMVKSPYHRSLLKNVSDEKFVIVPNGLMTEVLDKVKVKNNKHHVFYGSSYDRGLEGLLKIWPEVIKQVPEAELHICYGWNTFDKMHKDNPERQMWKKRMQGMMDHPSIKHHGRVGKQELYEIAGSCGVWAYPTTFEEIHCITGAYAQYLGLVPVVYNYAALETTVQFGKKLDISPFKKDSIITYKDELIKTLKGEQTRTKMMKAARDWGYNTTSKQWEEVFHED